MKTWEIERAFNEDIREKRKAGSGSFHRRGKGVKHGMSGALRTPSYYMTNKEKKQLNGEVSVSFMYETIIPIEEFKLKDEQLQKTMLTRWRELYDNMKIRTELGLSNKAFYDLVAELGIPKKPRVEGTKRTGRPKAVKVENKPKELPKKNLLDLVEEAVKEEQSKLIKETPKEIMVETSPVLVSTGITFNYNQISDIETLNRILTKCQLLMEDEPHKFRLEINLSEIIGK
jgi:hypothetical protein